MAAIEFTFKVTGSGERPEDCIRDAVESLRAGLQRWEFQPDRAGEMVDPPFLCAVNTRD